MVSITHQLKSTIFDRFQLAVYNFFPVFVICDIIIQALRNYCITRGQMYLEKTKIKRKCNVE